MSEATAAPITTDARFPSEDFRADESWMAVALARAAVLAGGDTTVVCVTEAAQPYMSAARATQFTVYSGDAPYR